jgi:hypothetical protein
MSSFGSVFDDHAALVIHGEMEFPRCCRGGPRLLALLPFQFDRVDAVPNESVRIGALVARVCQRHCGVIAERRCIFLASQVKAHAPALLARRFRQQTEAVTVADLVLAVLWRKPDKLLFSQGNREFWHFAGISFG